MAHEQPCLEARGIDKRFGPFVANAGVDFELRHGEVHALLGENGAGKSTFVNILSGLYNPDGGEIVVNGKPATITSPRDAIALGIGAVHQHFKLIPAFTVAENIQLGLVSSVRSWTKLRTHSERAIADFAESHGLEIPVSATVSHLSLPLQQRVEIVKILYWGSRILILDEPTAVLAPEEAKALLQYLQTLAEQGHSIIFISHKLEEVKDSCDRVTVLRRGRVVAQREMSSVTVSELAQLMVGREVASRVEKRSLEGNKRPVAEAAGLHVSDDRGHLAVRDVNLTIHSGEIVGIAGIEGNGQHELTQALYGTRNVDRGRVSLDGEEVTHLPLQRRQRLGIRAVPADRRTEGLVLGFTLYENLVLEERRVQRSWFRPLQVSRLREEATKLLDEYDIRASSVDARAQDLSGGNQQKLVLARVLSSKPRLLIAEHPFRGLDVGAASYVRDCLLRERERGTAILLVSPDLDEVLSLSDTIAVMLRGAIVAVLPAADVDRTQLGRLMLGATNDG